jgi:hypothetical protein
MNSGHLISKRASITRCRTCGRSVLAGWDEGRIARVDPTPLNRGDEIAALLAGKWTYSLMLGRWLVHRDAGRISDGLSGTVHAEHQCPRRTT